MRRLNDDGAVAVLVAIMAVLVFSFAAIVIDVGALYAERRQLQSGADAGALAIAKACATSGCPDTSSADSMATQYGGLNDLRDASAAGVICGTGLDAWPDCTSTATAPAPAVPPGVKYVRVTDRTVVENADGTAGTKLPPMLAQVLPGEYSGTRVEARSTVAWGYGTVSQSPTLPFIMSACEWMTLAAPPAGTGKGFAPMPPQPLGFPVYPDGVPYAGGTSPYGIPWSYESDIQIHGAGSCTYNPSGQTGLTQNLSGDFGWLQVPAGQSGANGACVPTTTTSSDGTTYVDGKNGTYERCVKNFLTNNLGKIIDIPIYTTQPANGAPYAVGGAAPFFLTGFSIPGTGNTKETSQLPGRPASLPTPTCLLASTPNTVQCLTGFLVTMPPTSGPVVGPSFGLTSTTTKIVE